MNIHLNTLISFIGLLCVVNYDIVGFYFFFKLLKIKKYWISIMHIIKIFTIICGCLIYLAGQYSKITSMPLGFIGNTIMALISVFILRYLTVKSNYFYFRFDDEFFRMWERNIKGR